MPSALVTGSAKGIGKALILALARHGYDVAIHYRSSHSEGEKVAQEAASHGVKSISLQADVTDTQQAQRLVKETHQHLGRLDVLINNVGDYHRGALSELSTEIWHEMFKSNLHSTFYTCQEAVKLMKQQNGGRIINIGYAGAEHLIARPSIVAYNIAKTGVILYSKSLAKTVAKDGITVNVISPGVIENSVSVPDNELPMERTGTLEEMVAAAMYLLSPDAAYVTGVTLEISGGWNL